MGRYLFNTRKRFLMRSEESQYPEYTYTGEHEFIDDGDGNWRIKLLTSGVFTLLNGNQDVDVFLVGGGGGGGGGYDNGAISYCYGGGGGGGGYTKTVKGMKLTKSTPYDTIIGAGGSAGSLTHTGAGYKGSNGGTGGTSTFNGESAEGGKGGNLGGSGYYSTDSRGGDGGSGGGGGVPEATTTTVIKGGTNGANGTTCSPSGRGPFYGGTGQGTTTREFGEEDGTLYSTGGDGGAYNYVPVKGNENTGDGGDGGGTSNGNDTLEGYTEWEGQIYWNETGFARYGTVGGSGIVIIRNSHTKIANFYITYQDIVYEYSFIKGMTWEEFVTSEYNDGKFSISGNAVLFNSDGTILEVALTSNVVEGTTYVTKVKFYIYKYGTGWMNGFDSYKNTNGVSSATSTTGITFSSSTVGSRALATVMRNNAYTVPEFGNYSKVCIDFQCASGNVNVGYMVYNSGCWGVNTTYAKQYSAGSRTTVSFDRVSASTMYDWYGDIAGNYIGSECFVGIFNGNILGSDTGATGISTVYNIWLE